MLSSHFREHGIQRVHRPKAVALHLLSCKVRRHLLHMACNPVFRGKDGDVRPPPSERRSPSHRPEEGSGSRRLERTSLCLARSGQCHRQVSLFYKGKGRGSSDAGGSTGDMDDLVHKGPGIHGSFSCSLFLPHDTGRRSPGEVPAFSPNAKRPQRGLLLRTSFLSDVLLFWEWLTLQQLPSWQLPSSPSPRPKACLPPEPTPLRSSRTCRRGARRTRDPAYRCSLRRLP